MSVLREIAVFLCGFLMLRICRAQVVFPGMCPPMHAMEPFDSARYLGKWYEAEAYFFLFEFGGKCITATYEFKDDKTIRVWNRQINVFSGAENQIKGEAVLVGNSDEAKLSVTFPSLPVNIAAPYWVIDTDYDNYAVVWSCYELGLFHARNAWILTRQRNPSEEVLQKAYKAIDKHRISRSFFIKTNQNNCSEDSIHRNVV